MTVPDATDDRDTGASAEACSSSDAIQARYRELLRSDRSHMRRANGAWLRPPPPWPCIGSGGSNLTCFVDMLASFAGEVLDLGGLRRRFAARD